MAKPEKKKYAESFPRWHTAHCGRTNYNLGTRLKMENLYHETQKFNMCGMHCLNNFLQRPEFSQDILDQATSLPAPAASRNPA